MNYILKYYELNELVKNSADLKFYIKRILNDINKVSKLKKSNIDYNDDRNVRVSINWVPENTHSKIIKILKSWVAKLMKHDIIMSFNCLHKQDVDFIDAIDSKDKADFDLIPNGKYYYEYILYFKNIHTNLIKPLDIVYHFTNVANRESILKNGLIPSKIENSKLWNEFSDLAYPPAIFAANIVDTDYGWYQGSFEKDIWMIDTVNLKNKWWEDLNFSKRKDMIMTFEPIAPEYLKLKDK